MLLGYELEGADGKEYVLGYKAELAPPHPCNVYRSIYDVNYLPAKFKLPGTKDFYYSSDGFLLVSKRVVSFCNREGYKNLEFISLNNDRYFWFKTHNIVRVNEKAGYFRFYGYNEKCKEYREVMRPGPLFLRKRKPLDDNFYRTDICFGGTPKGPEICIGVETYKKLKRQGFTGFYGNEICDKYDKKKLPNMEMYDKMKNPDFSFLDLLDEKDE